MVLRTMLTQMVLFVLCSASGFGQQTGVPIPAKAPDFPVVLQQSITAGKTPVGTKVQAKLAIATLLNGTVIPRNAVLAGEVTESAAKTATDPSRLAIRMDSVQWKNGSSAISLYFTGWYYPNNMDENGQDLQYGPQQPAQRTWNGQGQYPDPSSHVYRPFPGGDSDKSSSGPDESSSTTAKNSLLMKDIEVQRAGDGVILTSKHANIKLERYTTYVVATGDTGAQK